MSNELAEQIAVAIGALIVLPFILYIGLFYAL